MALTLGDNFSYQGAKPLDARLKYDTVAAMKAVADATMYEGCLAYCAGTDKTYQWKSGNTVDETTGKWREFTSGGGGGGETYTAGDGIDISAENEISTEKSEAGWMDEVIEKVPMSGALVNIANAFNRSDLYSTTEKIVGQWIDGKPLYQKVMEIANLPNTTDVNYPHNIPNVDFIFVKEGIGINGSNTFPLPLLHLNELGRGVAIYEVNSTYVQISSKTNRSTWSAKIVLQYTKTADSAIAIGSENEYSTDEKIVGSWIDGSPVYQKVIKLSNLIAFSVKGSWTNIADISSLNASRLIHCYSLCDIDDSIRHAPVFYKVNNGYLQYFQKDYGIFTEYESDMFIIQYTKLS